MRKILIFLIFLLCFSGCSSKLNYKTIDVTSFFDIKFNGTNGYGVVNIEENFDSLNKYLDEKEVENTLTRTLLLDTLKLVPRQKQYLSNLMKVEFLLEYDQELANHLGIRFVVDRNRDRFSKIVNHLPEGVFSYQIESLPRVSVDGVSSGVSMLTFSSDNEVLAANLNRVAKDWLAFVINKYQSIVDKSYDENIFNFINQSISVHIKGNVMLFVSHAEYGHSNNFVSQDVYESALAIDVLSGSVLDQNALLMAYGLNVDDVTNRLKSFVYGKKLTNFSDEALGDFSRVDKMLDYVSKKVEEDSSLAGELVYLFRYKPEDAAIKLIMIDDNFKLLMGQYDISNSRNNRFEMKFMNVNL